MRQVDEDIAEVIRYLRGRQAHYNELREAIGFTTDEVVREERDTYSAIADELHDIIETIWDRFDTSGDGE